MRKFTLILSSLLLFVTAAMAQFEANKCYTVVAEGHSKGGSPAWAVNDAGDEFVSTGNTTVSDEAQKNFAFIKFYGAGATTAANYIYSVWAKKFVNNNASLATSGPQAITIVSLDDGKYLFKYDNDHFINIGGEKQMVIDGWGDLAGEVDGGNTMTVTAVAGAVFSVDDLREAIAPLYVPTFTGNKTVASRMMGSISVNCDVYTMPANTTENPRKSYTDITGEKTFTVNAGMNIPLVMSSSAGSWMNAFVYIDKDNDGFTAGIDSDNYTPTGDLVSYSFYNAGYDNDENGRNSEGTSISGGSRSTLYLPKAKAPDTPGTYRIRFKYDWCSIDPYGADGQHFGQTLEGHGGEIIDATLVVLPALSDEAKTLTETLLAKLDIFKAYLDAGLIGENIGQYSSDSFDDALATYEDGETFYRGITRETEVSAIQDKVTIIEDLVSSLKLNMPKSGGVYTFESVERGWWASGEAEYLYSTGSTGASVTTANASVNNEALQWIVYKGNNGLYLYNVAAGKFITLGTSDNNVPLAATPNNSTLAFKESTKDGYPYLVGLDNKVINLNIVNTDKFPYGGCLWSNGWTDNNEFSDPGSAVRITYVKDADEATLVTVAKSVSSFEGTSYTLNVGATGFASLYLPYDVIVPDGVEAYIATSAGVGYVHMEQVTGVLPANTGAIVKADATNTSYDFIASAGLGMTPVVSGGAKIEDNLLLGTVDESPIQQEAYVLAAPNGSGSVAFYKAKMKEDYGMTFFNNKANRAYLPIDKLPAALQGSASFRFVFNNTTAVDELVEQRVENNDIYDLTGRRINEITKAGIYIIGGRKVFVK